MAGKNSAVYTATQWAPVTKSDVTILPPGVRAIYVGGVGDVVALGQDGVSGTFTVATAGTVLPIQPTKIMDATTATLMVALY